VSRRPAPLSVLSERDEAVLREVARLRFATAGQLTRLHFRAGTMLGRQRRAQAVLRRLTDDGYLDRLPRRIGGPGSGSARFVYQLGYRGQRAVRPSSRARTPSLTGWTFTCHCLAVAELVVELHEAEAMKVITGLQVVLEPDVCRRYMGRHGQPRRLCPDLGVDLMVNGRRLIWFVEVDRSTESLKQITGKAQAYLDYWRTGTEQAQLGAFPRVLWTVPDEKRCRAIVRVLDALPPPAEAMFEVTTHDQATRELAQGPIKKEGGET
jgi:hypothetical protein